MPGPSATWPSPASSGGHVQGSRPVAMTGRLFFIAQPHSNWPRLWQGSLASCWPQLRHDRSLSVKRFNRFGRGRHAGLSGATGRLSRHWISILRPQGSAIQGQPPLQPVAEQVAVVQARYGDLPQPWTVVNLFVGDVLRRWLPALMPRT